MCHICDQYPRVWPSPALVPLGSDEKFGIEETEQEMVPPPSPPPYRDTRLFKDAGNNAGRLPHILWEMLQ